MAAAAAAEAKIKRKSMEAWSVVQVAKHVESLAGQNDTARKLEAFLDGYTGGTRFDGLWLANVTPDGIVELLSKNCSPFEAQQMLSILVAEVQSDGGPRKRARVESAAAPAIAVAPAPAAAHAPVSTLASERLAPIFSSFPGSGRRSPHPAPVPTASAVPAFHPTHPPPPVNAPATATATATATALRPASVPSGAGATEPKAEWVTLWKYAKDYAAAYSASWTQASTLAADTTASSSAGAGAGTGTGGLKRAPFYEPFSATIHGPDKVRHSTVVDAKLSFPQCVARTVGELAEQIISNPVVSIGGPRRTAKSLLAQRLLDSEKKSRIVVYIDGAASIRSRAADRTFPVATELIPHGGAGAGAGAGAGVVVPDIKAAEAAWTSEFSVADAKSMEPEKPSVTTPIAIAALFRSNLRQSILHFADASIRDVMLSKFDRLPFHAHDGLFHAGSSELAAYLTQLVQACCPPATHKPLLIAIDEIDASLAFVVDMSALYHKRKPERFVLAEAFRVMMEGTVHNHVRYVVAGTDLLDSVVSLRGGLKMLHLNPGPTVTYFSMANRLRVEEFVEQYFKLHPTADAAAGAEESDETRLDTCIDQIEPPLRQFWGHFVGIEDVVAYVGYAHLILAGGAAALSTQINLRFIEGTAVAQSSVDTQQPIDVWNLRKCFQSIASAGTAPQDLTVLTERKLVPLLRQNQAIVWEESTGRYSFPSRIFGLEFDKKYGQQLADQTPVAVRRTNGSGTCTVR